MERSATGQIFRYQLSQPFVMSNRVLLAAIESPNTMMRATLVECEDPRFDDRGFGQANIEMLDQESGAWMPFSMTIPSTIRDISPISEPTYVSNDGTLCASLQIESDVDILSIYHRLRRAVEKSMHNAEIIPFPKSVSLMGRTDPYPLINVDFEFERNESGDLEHDSRLITSIIDANGRPLSVTYDTLSDVIHFDNTRRAMFRSTTIGLGLIYLKDLGEPGGWFTHNPPSFIRIELGNDYVRANQN